MCPCVPVLVYASQYILKTFLAKFFILDSREAISQCMNLQCFLADVFISHLLVCDVGCAHSTVISDHQAAITELSVTKKPCVRGRRGSMVFTVLKIKLKKGTIMRGKETKTPQVVMPVCVCVCDLFLVLKY